MNDTALLLRDVDADDLTVDGRAVPEADAPPARSPRLGSATLAARVARACGRVVPLWPLGHFVAVNPFLGLADQPFETAAGTVRQAAGARLTMPRAWYREQLDAGRISDRDLADAVAAHRRAHADSPLAALDVAALRAACEGDDAPITALPTLADALATGPAPQWPAIVVDEISKWCAAYYDGGQSAWRMPWRDAPPYAAWRAAAALDRTPETLGLPAFRARIASLPDEPLAAIGAMLERLAPPAESVDAYLHRLLASIAGWSGHARYRAWQQELRGGTDDSVAHVLAIRLAWEYALAEGVASPGDLDRWRADLGRRVTRTCDVDAALGCVLQDAFERSWRRTLFASLAAPPAPTPVRPAAQAVFCIDVRSEVYRRALESVAPDVATLGFAGFFGFAIEYVPFGREAGGARCPVLLAPAHRIRERAHGAAPEREESLLAARRLRRLAGDAWKSFRTSAVSCFSYVETQGVLYGAHLLRNSFTPKRAQAGSAAGARAALRLAPSLDGGSDAPATGIAPAARGAAAAGALQAMGLTRDLARLVLLCGHGSTTANNPYAAGLDCGACGGHAGDANARVAVAVLNDPAVRAGLVEHGLAVPADTVFVAGLHDTTTDEVRLYDTDAIPASHAADLEQLRERLRHASTLARLERASLLGLDRGAGERRVAESILERSRDWSQVRPEWGLAGNAAFVAAPRARTRGVDLGGRVFLHDYDAAQDPEWRVLELILTAPMVVASWINLQYYGSTVDNRAFGSGNKVLHNVVGTLGVLEGSGGDLRTGLPWQSVHDGTSFVHEPLRLTVCIEAPVERIDAVLARHANVRQLLDHGWLHLYALVDGRPAAKYAGGGDWEPAAA
jgi:uncharacterized protein YbcC (UPF0753/DUF2309 family)